MLCAAYKDNAGTAPRNIRFVVDEPTAPVTELAIVNPLYADRVPRDLIVGWHIHEEIAGGNIEPALLAAKAAKRIADLPVYAYIGSYIPAVKLPNIDVPILEAYSLEDHPSPADVLDYLRLAISWCAYPHAAWAIECTARKLPGFDRWTVQQRVQFIREIARRALVVQPAAVFAWAWDRSPIGMSDFPEVAAEWQRLVTTVSQPVEVPMQPYDEQKVTAFIVNVVRPAYHEAGRETDDLYPVWPVRTQRDYDVGMTWESSCAKHEWELRQALGLPVGPQPVPV